MSKKNNNAIDSSEQKTLESSTNKKQTNANKTPKKPFRWSAFITLIVFVLALTGIAAAAYIWQQFEHYKLESQQTLQNQLRQLEAQISEKLEARDVLSQITPAVEPLKSRLSIIEKANKKAELQRSSLSESTQKLFELYGRDKNGWQLAEVEYLLRIAQHRLVIENDFQGAEKTLKAADDKMSEIADPGLLAVRVAISDERILLQSRTRPDLVGIVLSLSRVVKQLPHIKLKVNKTSPIQAKKTLPINVDEAASWQDQTMQFLNSLVKVEPLKKSIRKEPSVSILDVIEAIEEKLILAKWAVLERDQKQYQSLVQQSSDLFKQYADADNAYHVELSNELKRLLSLEIRPELPDISLSLTTLKEIILRKEHAINKIKKERPIKQALTTKPQKDIQAVAKTQASPRELNPLTEALKTEGESHE